MLGTILAEPTARLSPVRPGKWRRCITRGCPATAFTAQWRFEVVAREAGPDGEWWHVQVRER